jgi:NADH-quinone oxidoreductase subunit F
MHACREGTWWMLQVLAALRRARALSADIDMLLDMCDNIACRSFCALPPAPPRA